MDTKPIFIQAVINIDKRELEDPKAKQPHYLAGFRGNGKQEKENGFCVYYAHPWSKEDGVNLKLDLVIAPFSPEIVFCGSVAFTATSANYTVKKHATLFDDKEAGPIVLCSLSDALDPEKKFLVNGKLDIRIDALLFVKRHFPSVTPLSKLLWARGDRDFKIVAFDGSIRKEFMVHKLVLATRSTTFDAIFKGGAKEKTELKYRNIDAKVIETVIAYCYDHDNLDGMDLRFLFTLLQFVNYAGMEDLKKKIEYVLQFHIFPDTIVKIANVAMSSTCDALKDVCLKVMLIYLKNEISVADVKLLNDAFAIEMVQYAMGASK